MTTKVKKTGALAALLTALAALVVMVAGSATAAGKPIIIGYPTDFTGRMAPFDGPAVSAAQVRIKQINAKGGINGRPVKLITCDTQDSNPQKSKACAASRAASAPAFFTFVVITSSWVGLTGVFLLTGSRP